MNNKPLPLSSIRIDGGTQSRVSISEQAVADYAEALTAGDSLPPVLVFFDGVDHWLADGFHRLHANRQIGAVDVLAEVRDGTLNDAKLYAYGANRMHGLRRTNDDKRKAVAGMLADFGDWSDRQIAKHVGVGHPFVAAVRNPVVAERQKKARAKSGGVESDSTQAPKTAEVESDSTPADAPQQTAPEEDIDGPTAEELAAAEAEQADEYAALQVLIGADDKLGAALAEVKRQAALIRILEERVRGLQNSNNEHIRLVKSWRAKYEKLAKATA